MEKLLLPNTKLTSPLGITSQKTCSTCITCGICTACIVVPPIVGLFLAPVLSAVLIDVRNKGE